MKAYKRGPKKCVSRGPPAALNNDINTPVGFSTLGLKILETSLKSLKAYKQAPKWCLPHRLPPATMIAIPLLVFNLWSKNPRNNFKSFKRLQTSPKMVWAQMPAAHNHNSNTPFGFSTIG
jgi:hypothetical protein